MSDLPLPADEGTRIRMRRQGRRDTKPELAVRRRLHAFGYRFRVDYKPEPDLRCRGDIVFTKRKLVVFVDGCFWHGCPIHATAPKNNAEWWREKLDANMARDRRTDLTLERRGWTVLRLWEHLPAEEATAHIVDALTGRSADCR